MLYPFIILEDNTEIVHLESYIENGVEKVRVEIEKPVEGGFYSAECILPEYAWQNIKGGRKRHSKVTGYYSISYTQLYRAKCI